MTERRSSGTSWPWQCAHPSEWEDGKGMHALSALMQRSVQQRDWMPHLQLTATDRSLSATLRMRTGARRSRAGPGAPEEWSEG